MKSFQSNEAARVYAVYRDSRVLANAFGVYAAVDQVHDHLGQC